MLKSHVFALAELVDAWLAPAHASAPGSLEPLARRT